MTSKNFEDLIQEPLILQAIQDLGFTNPSDIQQQAIPEVLKGKDLRASAQTGTGKTAAFMLPALCRLLKKSSTRGPKILVLVPTRELAMQVVEETTKLSRHLRHINSVFICGGIPYHVQNRKLSRNFDILIATPGRLIECLEEKRIHLSNLEMLILDEADRMLDMGFIEPVEYIASMAPKSRQTLMFSATYDAKVLGLANSLLTNPTEVIVEKKAANYDLIEQHIHKTNNLEQKYKFLDEILSDPNIEKAIIFSSTQKQTEQIADKLCDDGRITAAALHGGMNQQQRTRTMKKIRNGDIKVIVATDVMSRGIDIPEVSHVINFDLPKTLDDYVHRIGRTGRAGAKGKAFSFASSRDYQMLDEVERFIDDPSSKPQSRGRSRSRSFQPRRRSR
ncbi:MAG: ATP-dependent helicase [Chlamydiae bacterium]|nr:MAG: ATP-dependent helicase [Chlamydiota bacterium]